MKTKEHIKVEIDGRNILVESTLETEKLIGKAIELEDLIDNSTSQLKKSKFGTKEFLDETHDAREDLANKIGEATTELTLVRGKLKDKIYIQGESGFKYDITLDSDEGILLANLLVLNMTDIRGKVTPTEGRYREDLLEKVHPANNRTKEQEKKESLIRIEVGEGIIGNEHISHLSSLDEVTFVTDKATYKIGSCPGCFSLTLDRTKIES